MAITYMGTLAACVLLNIDPNEKMMRAFEGAGMFILGAFSSILVNTRSQQPEPTTLSVHARSDTDSIVHPATDSNPRTASAVAHPDAKPHSGANTPSVSASATSTTESS